MSLSPRERLEEDGQWKATLADRILDLIKFLDPENQEEWKKAATLEGEVLGFAEYLDLYICRRISKFRQKLEEDGRILPKGSQASSPLSSQGRGVVKDGKEANMQP